MLQTMIFLRKQKNNNENAHPILDKNVFLPFLKRYRYCIPDLDESTDPIFRNRAHSTYKLGVGKKEPTSALITSALGRVMGTYV
jgi:hypothetical protein